MRAALYPELPKHLALASIDLQETFGDELTQYARIVAQTPLKGCLRYDSSILGEFVSESLLQINAGESEVLWQLWIECCPHHSAYRLAGCSLFCASS